jgi:glycyl-tRNA synthetase beta chain
MRTNQKYFALTNGEGRLAPNFICTANIEASDGGAAILQGNERVLSARLSDAKFFWEQDLKVPLEEQAKKLDQIVFHEKLGTVADKVERVAKLARWLVEEGIVKPPLPRERDGVRGSGASASSSNAATPHPTLSREGEGSLADLAETAARLCKADLVTGMVGEFPELQGVIGGYLARAQGHPDAIADAIRDHYKPVGQGDEVPTAPVTVAVSLADRLDTLAAFFSTGMFPTGSKDPFALRRSAIAALRLDQARCLNMNWGLAIMRAFIEVASSLMKQAYQPELHKQLLDGLRDFEGRTREDLSFEEEVKLASQAAPSATRMLRFDLVVPIFVSFLIDRLEVQQRDQGVRHDLIDAVFSLAGEVRLGSLLARVKALQAFVETPEGTDLLAGYKRAANILKKEGWEGSASVPPRHPELGGDQIPLSYTPENEEAALIAALDAAEPKAQAAVGAEDFEGAMAALASLRTPVDNFFDKVTVNDPDPAKREARLNLLMRMRDAVHRVADFSKIEG